MRKEYIDFICNLHGYLIRLKEIHWNTNSNAQHLLCDEITDALSDCEDRFAECAMGISGTHFRVGDLKPYLPNAKELIPMLKELENEVKDIRTKLEGNSTDFGLVNILDDMLEACGKYKYRATQK
jgi:DNA-binding ferritin-like protein